MYYVYMVACADGTWYTGYTTDLEHRVAAHNEGKGAKYTKSRRPVTLIYHEAYQTRSDAQKREYQIKQLTRREKESLVRAFTDSAES